MVANCVLWNCILRQSRSAIALPRSTSRPMMLPSSSMYWIGATVGLIAAIITPLRTSGGRPILGSQLWASATPAKAPDKPANAAVNTAKRFIIFSLSLFEIVQPADCRASSILSLAP